MGEIQLDQVFTHRSHSHEYKIQWKNLGSTDLPPLIFIHGTPWSSVVWHDLASCLLSRYSVYIYDHPGFGQSPIPSPLSSEHSDDMTDLDPSLTLRAEASAALFKHWDLKQPPHIVAHDNGGLVSLRLLLQHNIQFASLCLIDVVAMGASGLPFFKLVAENEDVFAAVPPHLIEGFVRGYVQSAMYKHMSREIEDLLSRPWLADGSQGPKRFLREMIQAHHRDVGKIKDDYHKVGDLTPVKIIWGEDDAWIPVETSQKLKDALHAQEVVVIEKAGHLVHYDQPSKLALELGLWLGKKDK